MSKKYIEWRGETHCIREWAEKLGINENLIYSRLRLGKSFDEVFVQEKNEFKKTLCWACRNAVPSEKCGCSWSREFKPVAGWNAEHTIINLAINTKYHKKVKSFCVKACPKFVKD